MLLPRLIVLGYGRHGKDTVCELLRDTHNFTFESSSKFCSQLFIFNELKGKYGYANEAECYADRHNHRAEWFNLISGFCEPDAAKLGRAIFSKYNIYCGLRNKREFNSMKNQGVFDYAIWVDRSDHLEAEAKDSMSIEPWMADFIIDNNRDKAALAQNVNDLARTIANKHCYTVEQFDNVYQHRLIG
jgi:hypothetical protein